MWGGEYHTSSLSHLPSLPRPDTTTVPQDENGVISKVLLDFSLKYLFGEFIIKIYEITILRDSL